MASNKKT